MENGSEALAQLQVLCQALPQDCWQRAEALGILAAVTGQGSGSHGAAPGAAMTPVEAVVKVLSLWQQVGSKSPPAASTPSSTWQCAFVGGALQGRDVALEGLAPGVLQKRAADLRELEEDHRKRKFNCAVEGEAAVPDAADCVVVRERISKNRENKSPGCVVLRRDCHSGTQSGKRRAKKPSPAVTAGAADSGAICVDGDSDGVEVLSGPTKMSKHLHACQRGELAEKRERARRSKLLIEQAEDEQMVITQPIGKADLTEAQMSEDELLRCAHMPTQHDREMSANPTFLQLSGEQVASQAKAMNATAHLLMGLTDEENADFAKALWKISSDLDWPSLDADGSSSSDQQHPAVNATGGSQQPGAEEAAAAKAAAAKAAAEASEAATLAAAAAAAASFEKSSSASAGKASSQARVETHQLLTPASSRCAQPELCSTPRKLLPAAPLGSGSKRRLVNGTPFGLEGTSPNEARNPWTVQGSDPVCILQPSCYAWKSRLPNGAGSPGCASRRDRPHSPLRFREDADTAKCAQATPLAMTSTVGWRDGNNSDDDLPLAALAKPRASREELVCFLDSPRGPDTDDEERTNQWSSGGKVVGFGAPSSDDEPHEELLQWRSWNKFDDSEVELLPFVFGRKKEDDKTTELLWSGSASHHETLELIYRDLQVPPGFLCQLLNPGV